MPSRCQLTCMMSDRKLSELATLCKDLMDMVLGSHATLVLWSLGSAKVIDQRLELSTFPHQVFQASEVIFHPDYQVN